MRSRPREILKRALARGGWAITRYPNRLGLAYHLVRLLTKRDADCVLDVGANRGQFALMLRDAGYRGRIISFEPVREAFTTLAQRSAGDPAWEVRPVALADTPGTLPLHVAASSSVSSFLVPTDEYQRRYEGAHVEAVTEVPVTTLDLAASPTWKRPFVKVDTQGFDLRVLDGAHNLLERAVGVQLELSVIPVYGGMPDYLDALLKMRDLGFTLSGIFPVASDEQLRAIELDGVFVRE